MKKWLNGVLNRLQTIVLQMNSAWLTYRRCTAAIQYVQRAPHCASLAKKHKCVWVFLPWGRAAPHEGVWSKEFQRTSHQRQCWVSSADTTVGPSHYTARLVTSLAPQSLNGSVCTITYTLAYIPILTHACTHMSIGQLHRWVGWHHSPQTRHTRVHTAYRKANGQWRQTWSLEPSIPPPLM